METLKKRQEHQTKNLLFFMSHTDALYQSEENAPTDVHRIFLFGLVMNRLKTPFSILNVVISVKTCKGRAKLCQTGTDNCSLRFFELKHISFLNYGYEILCFTFFG